MAPIAPLSWMDEYYPHFSASSLEESRYTSYTWRKKLATLSKLATLAAIGTLATLATLATLEPLRQHLENLAGPKRNRRQVG